MSRRALKNEVINLLQQRRLPEIVVSLEKYPPHSLLGPLFTALCHPVEKVRWNSVLCFGNLVPSIAENDPEAARIIMRRFLWSLNDESGGIGWGVPEAMAEVMCHSKMLRDEYLHMLISYMREDGDNLFEDGNYLELPLLQRGLLWGMGRLCQEHRQEMVEREIVEDVRAYLKSEDRYVVGLSLWCLYQLGAEVDDRTRLLSYTEKIELFLDNRMIETSVAELVALPPKGQGP